MHENNNCKHNTVHMKKKLKKTGEKKPFSVSFSLSSLSLSSLSLFTLTLSSYSAKDTRPSLLCSSISARKFSKITKVKAVYGISRISVVPNPVCVRVCVCACVCARVRAKKNEKKNFTVYGISRISVVPNPVCVCAFVRVCARACVRAKKN